MHLYFYTSKMLFVFRTIYATDNDQYKTIQSGSTYCFCRKIIMVQWYAICSLLQTEDRKALLFLFLQEVFHTFHWDFHNRNPLISCYTDKTKVVSSKYLPLPWKNDVTHRWNKSANHQGWSRNENQIRNYITWYRVGQGGKGIWYMYQINAYNKWL